jgi:hypothetical protein
VVVGCGFSPVGNVLPFTSQVESVRFPDIPEFRFIPVSKNVVVGNHTGEMHEYLGFSDGLFPVVVTAISEHDEGINWRWIGMGLITLGTANTLFFDIGFGGSLERLLSLLRCMRKRPMVGTAAGHGTHLEYLQLDALAGNQCPGFIPIDLPFDAPVVTLRHERLAGN